MAFTDYMPSPKPGLCQLDFSHADQATSAIPHTPDCVLKGATSQVLAKMASALLGTLVLLLFCMNSLHAEDVRKIDRMEVTSSQVDVLPGESASWQLEKLPWFRSFLVNPDVPDFIWLRFELPKAEVTQALLTTRHTRSLAVYVNGQLLQNERQDHSLDYSGWNIPLMIELQPGTLDRERNEIVLGLYKSVGTSYINPVYVGSRTDIEALYLSATLAQIEIPLAVMLSCGILGALSLGLWLIRRQNREYLYFCGACLCWGYVMLYMIKGEPPLHLGIWHWMVSYYFAAELSGLCLAAFLCRVLGLPARRWLMGALVFFTLSTLLISALPPYIGIAISMFSQALAMLGIVILMIIVVLRVLHPSKTQSPDERRKLWWIAASLLTLILFPLYDMVDYIRAQMQGLGFDGKTMAQFSFPASLAIIFVHLAHQQWTALDNSDRLRRELVQRVQQATRELEQHLQARHQQEIRQSTEQERQKIYRDLHDDVGAKLTSILHSADDERQQQMARSALEALRETIHRANYLEQSLQEWLATIEAEMSVRLHAAKLEVEFLYSGEIPPRVLNAGENYHLTRALRELTNNILHHARARHVALKISSGAAGRISLELIDDGRGFEPAAASGNGLASIQARLHDIGGTVEWQSQLGAGCRVLLKF